MKETVLTNWTAYTVTCWVGHRWGRKQCSGHTTPKYEPWHVGYSFYWSLGLERSPGGGNGYPLQYSCLENSMDRGSWLAAVHRIARSPTWLSDWHYCCYSWFTRLLSWLCGKEIACWCRRREFWSLGRKDPLEKEMATHSSMLAWEIPQTEDPGGLQTQQQQLIYSVVLISTIQQSDSGFHAYMFFFILFSILVDHRILSVVPCAI